MDSEIEGAMLRRVVTHEGRMGVLCLLDGASLSASLLAAFLERPEKLIGYWLAMLDVFDLVEWNHATATYAATLDDQPEWVREAVRQNCARVLDPRLTHRPHRRIGRR